MATTWKTPYGDRAPKWPSTDRVFALIEEVDKEMRALFNEAAERSETDSTINERGQRATAERFNVLGGQ